MIDNACDILTITHNSSKALSLVALCTYLCPQQQAMGMVQLEVAPNGVIQNVYPNIVGGKGLDLLVCCNSDSIREIESGTLRKCPHGSNACVGSCFDDAWSEQCLRAARHVGACC